MADKYEVGMIEKLLTTSSENKTENIKTLVDLFSHKEIQIEDDLQLHKEYIEDADKPMKEEPVKKNNKEKGRDSKEELKKRKLEEKERLKRTIFVGNVALTSTRKTLKKLFTKYGTVETVRIRSIPSKEVKLPKKVALIRKDFHEERDSMNAYVVFKEEESANKALESNGVLIDGLHLRVDSATKDKIDQKRCLFVGNLPFSLKEEEVRDHFSECGCIEDVRVIRDKTTGMGKGFAYVRFKNSEDVILGLKLHNSEIKGRKIRVFRSREQPQTQAKAAKKSFRGMKATSKADVSKKLLSEGKIKSQNALFRINKKHLKQKAKKPR